jgi:hypothetical protein
MYRLTVYAWPDGSRPYAVEEYPTLEQARRARDEYRHRLLREQGRQMYQSPIEYIPDTH